MQSREEKIREVARSLVMCRRLPDLFITKILKKKLRGWQARTVAKIKERIRRGERRIFLSIVTCYGAGKSTLAAMLFLWVMFCWRDAKGITLASTWKQVDSVLWAKVRTLYAGSVLSDPDINFATVYDGKPELKVRSSGDWSAFGLSSDNAGALKGHHGNAAVRVIDEATEVDEDFRERTKGIRDAPEFFLDIAISNAWTESGWFYEHHTAPDLVPIRERVTIDDLIADGVPGKAEEKADAIREIGGNESDPLFRCEFFAEFMPIDAMSRVSSAAVDACMSRPAELTGSKSVSVDVAYSTEGDENVITRAQGFDVISQDAFRLKDTAATADRTLFHVREHGAEVVVVDANGVGAGVASDIRKEIKDNGLRLRLQEFGVGPDGKASNPERFADRRTEAAWEFCERVNQRACSLPNDPILKHQILQIRFETPGGRIRLAKASGSQKSPDRFDSAVMATSGPRLSVADAMLAGFRGLGPVAKEARA